MTHKKFFTPQLQITVDLIQAVHISPGIALDKQDLWLVPHIVINGNRAFDTEADSIAAISALAACGYYDADQHKQVLDEYTRQVAEFVSKVLASKNK